MDHRLPSFIDDSASRYPDHDAFRCESRAITYEQLVAQSNQLSRLLLDQGVQHGDRVGVFLPRVLETAVAVFGVLKSGAAFVPIDPLLPVARVKKIIEDCEIKHLICGPNQRKAVEELLRDSCDRLNAVIGIDNIEGGPRSFTWDSIASFAESDPGVKTKPDDLAYVMYTSGSTGRPKGIMHTHFSGANYARLSAQTYDVRSDDCIGNHSPLHFDMSTFGYLTAPLVGATTIIIPAAYTKLPASLSALIESQKVTIWYSVPFALIQMLARGALHQRDFSRLRWVLFGGEPFPLKHLRDLMQQWPHASFSNVYGPAEVNQCTYFHLPRRDEPEQSDEQVGLSCPIPIGKTWAETEGMVMSDGKLVLPGETGELLIHSPTMMKGYWGRPDLDEQVFYVHRNDLGMTKTFYRTGDLVRLDHNGGYTFLGRQDRQIKLRGHRIELDEIEAIFASHPAVVEAGVYPIRENDEIVDLGATIRTHETSQTAFRSIAAFAAEHLPAYAVPKSIRISEDLPRTTSGKIDRRRLQEQAEQEFSQR